MFHFAQRMLILSIIISAGTIATGCSPNTPPAPVADAKSAADAPAPTMPSGYELNDAIQQPIDRAKAVEGDVIKAKDDLDAQMDAQGG